MFDLIKFRNQNPHARMHNTIHHTAQQTVLNSDLGIHANVNVYIDTRTEKSRALE